VFSISSGDDGMHADSNLEINGDEIYISQSYEGLESAIITINHGDIYIVSSDDGINVAGGGDGSGMFPGPGRGGSGWGGTPPEGTDASEEGGPGQGRMRPQGGQPPQNGDMPQGGLPPRDGDMAQGGQPSEMGQMGGPGQESFPSTGDYYLYINGGYVVVDAGGDGLDVNGSIEMTDGVVIVNGPTMNMNGALDYDGSFTITGGFLVAAGSSGMAQAPGSSSSQYSLLLNFDSTQAAGTLVHIQNSDGDDVLSFSPGKEFQSIVFSSSDLVQGVSYDVYLGGSADGSVQDGLYQNGSYTPGSQYTSFTISDVVTQLGGRGR
jgi:hypothetical protein